MSVKKESFGLTHVGKKRSHNEDAIFLSDELGLYMIADGMGGHAHGEVASRLAIETISQRVAASDQPHDSSCLTEAIKQANNRIFEYSKERPELLIESGALMFVLIRPLLSFTCVSTASKLALT